MVSSNGSHELLGYKGNTLDSLGFRFNILIVGGTAQSSNFQIAQKATT
jgi:hypothetical protein